MSLSHILWLTAVCWLCPSYPQSKGSYKILEIRTGSNISNSLDIKKGNKGIILFLLLFSWLSGFGMILQDWMTWWKVCLYPNIIKVGGGLIYFQRKDVILKLKSFCWVNGIFIGHILLHNLILSIYLSQRTLFWCEKCKWGFYLHSVWNVLVTFKYLHSLP